MLTTAAELSVRADAMGAHVDEALLTEAEEFAARLQQVGNGVRTSVQVRA